MKRRGFFTTCAAAITALLCPIKATPKPVVYGWIEEPGLYTMDSRAILALRKWSKGYIDQGGTKFNLPPGAKLPKTTIEGDEVYVPWRTSRGKTARGRFLNS